MQQQDISFFVFFEFLMASIVFPSSNLMFICLQRDLMSDEEIFTEKMSELKELEAQVKLATDRSDQAEEEIERLKRRESELYNKVTTAATTTVQ